MNQFTKALLASSIAFAVAGCNSSNEEQQVQTNERAIQECQTFITAPDVIVKGDANAQLDELTITLAATGDMHGRIFSHDYATNNVDNNAGYTKIASILNSERKQDPNLILIDLGDAVQGNSAELFNDLPVHPVVETLNSMNYDVWVPGNHEFDFERSFLDRNLTNFNGSVISSNIVWDQHSDACKTNGKEIPFLRGFQIFNVNGAKVAVVGLTPSMVTSWQASSPQNFRNLDFKEEIDAVRDAVDAAIDQYQPDVVIGALHYGRKDFGKGVHMIAEQLGDRFDVIFNGHEHSKHIERVYADRVDNISVEAQNEQENTDRDFNPIYNHENRAQSVKVIEPGNWGWALAKAQIKLSKNDAGEWQIQDTTLSNVKVADVEQDENLADKMKWVHEASYNAAESEIGKVQGNFTLSGVERGELSGGADTATAEDVVQTEDGGRLYSTIHIAKTADMPVVNLINQIQIMNVEEKAVDDNNKPLNLKVDVSAASLFANHSNLKDGEDYRSKDSAKLYMYDNQLVAVKIRGDKLKEYMEWSYSYLNQWKEGDITVSFNTNARAYNYDHFAGNINYSVDISKPVGERIDIEQLSGAAFDPAKKYVMAVNDYRYASTLLTNHWVTPEDQLWISANEQTYAVRDMLTEYVAKNKTLKAEDFYSSNWYIKQVGKMDKSGLWIEESKGEILKAREGEGKALWTALQNKEVCVVRGDNRDKAIDRAVNYKDQSTYFANPEQSYEGCSYDNQRKAL
ncbi:5'-nucleotidase C-terminal domain-containing protein [Vibrio sp. SCSIO 43136]|uniref:bifunctional metallophosphatase/5'-nucleotidase n=1 Tax=Vibrio sp. SCSIO 43136 TaxID=2819101 RepID=UPI0020755FA3|nr:5'-nucleotidase C-terminal domain-containing protein [Vibrio sp. SCSIO 43136]USD67048.1 5'-nucleotidase C-terminal domain-containing protein [Vibrio sp. SCSIO 43136]